MVNSWTRTSDKRRFEPSTFMHRLCLHRQNRHLLSLRFFICYGANKVTHCKAGATMQRHNFYKALRTGPGHNVFKTSSIYFRHTVKGGPEEKLLPYKGQESCTILRKANCDWRSAQMFIRWPTIIIAGQRPSGMNAVLVYY